MPGSRALIFSPHSTRVPPTQHFWSCPAVYVAAVSLRTWLLLYLLWDHPSPGPVTAGIWGHFYFHNFFLTFEEDFVHVPGLFLIDFLEFGGWVLGEVTGLHSLCLSSLCWALRPPLGWESSLCRLFLASQGVALVVLKRAEVVNWKKQPVTVVFQISAFTLIHCLEGLVKCRQSGVDCVFLTRCQVCQGQFENHCTIVKNPHHGRTLCWCPFAERLSG